MNTSGEAADQVVRMSLEVGEAALKITGAGAKQLAVLLYAVLRNRKRPKGGQGWKPLSAPGNR